MRLKCHVSLAYVVMLLSFHMHAWLQVLSSSFSGNTQKLCIERHALVRKGKKNTCESTSSYFAEHSGVCAGGDK